MQALVLQRGRKIGAKLASEAPIFGPRDVVFSK
jgi:hypothetical protein